MFNIINQSENYIQHTLIPFNDPFSIAFYIGDFGLRWYSVFIMLGFFISIIIGCLTCHYRYKVKYDALFWFCIILIPVSILGARFWSACIGDLQWENFFNFGTGGLAIQGGIIFVIIAAFIYFPIIFSKASFHVRIEENGHVYIRKPSLWIMADIIIPLVLLGQAIGRWGNFFNGEIFGQEVSAGDLSWLKALMPGVFDHMQAVAPTTVGQTLDPSLVAGAYYQPLFLYEFFINIICFLALYYVLPITPKIKIGTSGSCYFILYGITRYVMESLRFDAYAFEGTYIMNGLLIAGGMISLICAQFICPRYRNKQIWYRWYVYYIRLPLIKLGRVFKCEWVDKYYFADPQLKNYGYKKIPDFTRTDSDILYYANR